MEGIPASWRLVSRIFLFRNWQLGWVGYPSCALANALPLPISRHDISISIYYYAARSQALERNGLEDALPVPMWSWVPGKEDPRSPVGHGLAWHGMAWAMGMRHVYDQMRKALRTELFFSFGQAEGMNVTMLFWLHFLLLPASGKLRSARHCLAAPRRPRPSRSWRPNRVSGALHLDLLTR